MKREMLKKQQPVVYQALENACNSKRISNAYLFSGPYGTPKHEAAILLAQSIFCEKQSGLACGVCNNCRRVEEGLYADMVILNGNDKAISKADVDAIQEKFSKTALEKGNGERVYIIENAETASVSAQNSMLKFLEEPGAGVTAILTTDNAGRILPTILSRCTILPFTPMSEHEYYEAALAEGIPKEDAYFLSHIAKNIDEIKTLHDTEAYQNAVMMFKQYLNIDGLKDELLIDYDISYRSSEKDNQKAKRSNLILLQAFFDLLSLYGHDVIKRDAKGPSWYDNAVMHADQKKEYYAKLIMIANTQKDLVNRFNDLNLVLAQAIYKLEELENGNNL